MYPTPSSVLTNTAFSLSPQIFNSHFHFKFRNITDASGGHTAANLFLHVSPVFRLLSWVQLQLKLNLSQVTMVNRALLLYMSTQRVLNMSHSYHLFLPKCFLSNIHAHSLWTHWIAQQASLSCPIKIRLADWSRQGWNYQLPASRWSALPPVIQPHLKCSMRVKKLLHSEEVSCHE